MRYLKFLINGNIGLSKFKTEWKSGSGMGRRQTLTHEAGPVSDSV
jgi:hypothetical protein